MPILLTLNFKIMYNIIKDVDGTQVNFQLTQHTKLITLSEGFGPGKAFRVALPIDATEAITIKAKLVNGDNAFQDVPIFLGGWNEVYLTEIATTGHSDGATTLWIGR